VRPGATVSLHVGSSIAGIVEHVREQVDLAVVAIDIPIGLPERNGRTAEALVRAQLPGKASSVFSTATRAAYLAADYDAARAASIATTDAGVSVSRQSWALGPKVLEVDAWVRTRPGVAVIEAHPELAFARLAGAPVLASKHTAEGLAARRDLLASIGLAVPPMYPGMGFGEDDLLDACVLTWTATRHVLGTGECFPDPPELLDGLEAAIHL
jgi:predicted RNase H-like nuclease